MLRLYKCTSCQKQRFKIQFLNTCALKTFLLGETILTPSLMKDRGLLEVSQTPMTLTESLIFYRFYQTENSWQSKLRKTKTAKLHQVKSFLWKTLAKITELLFLLGQSRWLRKNSKNINTFKGGS